MRVRAEGTIPTLIQPMKRKKMMNVETMRNNRNYAKRTSFSPHRRTASSALRKHTKK